MKKRLMVTGAKGFVAGTVVRQAGAEWEVHALARGGVPFEREGLIWHQLDLLDFDRLRKVFANVKPDAVVHAAAVADIDFCENNRETAEAVNVGLTREIVNLCGESIRLVHCSTDTVFAGDTGMYVESDAPGPVNFYAETKAKAEEIVTQGAGNAAIPRLCIVMGLLPFASGNSFLERLIAPLEAGREVGVPDEEIRSPVDVITLARSILELAANEFRGFIHMAGNDVMDRWSLSRRIAELLHLNPDIVVVKNPGNLPGRATRPRDVSLDNSLARATLKTPTRGLEDGLQLVMDNKGV